MRSDEAESQLLESLRRLEVAFERTLKSDGYKNEAKKMRLLAEMIKEQVRHENLVSSTRPVR